MNSEQSKDNEVELHQQILANKTAQNKRFKIKKVGEPSLYHTLKTHANTPRPPTQRLTSNQRVSLHHPLNYLNYLSELINSINYFTSEKKGDSTFDRVLFGYRSGYGSTWNTSADGAIVNYRGVSVATNTPENPPFDVAGNEHQEADPTTCERGREMYVNNTSTPPDGVPPAPPNHSNFKPVPPNNNAHASKLVIIDQEYLGGSVKDASEKHRVLCVKSAMGTGKTTAMRAIIQDLPDDAKILFISSRRKLLRTLAYSLQLSYYEDLNDADKSTAAGMAGRLAITPQSLHKVLSTTIAYDYIVIDESESVAAMLVSNATGEKEKAFRSLKTIAASSKHIIAMDAFLGERTDTLLSIMTGEESPAYLVNMSKRWNAITAQILDGGKYSDRVKSSNALQVQSINEGQRIAISSSSAEYATTRYQVLKTQYPQLKIALITGKDTPEARRLMNNPDSAGDYDILIFSPAVSIGVSFDIKNHFQTVFGVYPNVLGTGDSDDAVQGMARIRHPEASQWVIALDDDKQVYRNHESVNVPADIQRIIVDRYRQSTFAGGSTQQLTTDGCQVAELHAVCQFYRVTDKNNFNARFRSKLSEMGVKLCKLDNSDVEQSIDSEMLTEEVKLVKKEVKNKERTKSAKIDEYEYHRLGAVQKFRPNEITEEQRASMARYRFEEKYNIDCDTANPSQIEKYLALDDDGVIDKCRNREIALAEADFDKQYIKARIDGLHDSESFKVDIVDSKLNYRLKKKLLAYALPYINGEEYSHASLKNGALVKFVQRNFDEIVVAEVMALPNKWKDKPALLVNQLLDLIGFRHTHSQRRIRGKVHRIYTAIPDANVDELCQMRSTTGKDWVNQTLHIMGLCRELTKIPEAKTRLERLWQDVGRTDDIQAFLAEFADDIDDIESGAFNDETMMKIVSNWAA